MKHKVYYHGTPGKKFGIYSAVSKQFMFGICEDTPMLAMARLYQRIGADAKDKRYEPRMLPEVAK